MNIKDKRNVPNNESKNKKLIMGFKIHGKFELAVQGEIIIARFYQSWNKECAKDFFITYKNFILAQNFKQWGAFVDFRKFEGATPQAIKYFEKITLWAKANGIVCRAQITNSKLTEYVANKPSQGQDHSPIKTFKDEVSAFNWLEAQGLTIK